MIEEKLPGHGPLTPYGVLVHTTGEGIPKKADKDGISVLETTRSVYKSMAGADGVGPHFAITPAGEIIRFRGIDEKAWHAGVPAEHRKHYLSGYWEQKPALYAINNGADLIRWWKLRWPGYASPQHLYPGKSPNEAYIGIEMVPCGYVKAGNWAPVFGFGATPKSRFTAIQYQALAMLCYAIQVKLDLPEDWEQTSRLVGHEDVSPITRPGWDPGAYQGWFDWGLLRGMIQGLQLHSSPNVQTLEEGVL